MKKVHVLAIALAVVLALSLVCFTACDAEKTYTGYCKYENGWTAGKFYGTAADVTIKGGVITAVSLHADSETGWARTTASWKEGQNAGDLGYDKAEAAYADYLEKFIGMKVEDVMNLKAEAGKSVESADYNLAGATQSASRIILAIQNACAQDGEHKATGSASYENAWSAGNYYGAKMDVTVKDGIVTAIKFYTDAETGWTRTSGSWTEGQNAGDLGHDKAEAAYADYIDSFIGKSVSDIMSLDAYCTQASQTVEPASARLTGATQSSARIIRALQDAIMNLGK